MKPTWESDCGRVKLWHADCFAVLPELSQVGAVTITDPPYGTENDTGYGRQQNYSEADGKGRTIAGDKTTDTIEQFLKAVRTKRCAMFVSPRNWRQIDRLVEANGWDDEAWLVWDKSVPGLGFPIQYAHELIAILHRDSKTLEKPTVSIHRYYSEARRDATNNHPHQKPRALLSKLVRLYNEQIVIDPFMGSGTTGFGALDNHKMFYGIEKDDGWFTSSVDRFKRELKQLSMFNGKIASQMQLTP